MATDSNYNLVPASANPYGLQPAVYASADNPYGLMDATSPAPDTGARFFTRGGTAELRAYQPTAWDKIRSLFNSKAAEPGLNTSPLTEAIGSLIPQSAAPVLSVAKRYGVDPLDRAAQAGADAGREVGRDVVTGVTLLQHSGDYLNATLPSPYGPKPPVESVERRTEREHPVALGVAGGVGSVVGSTVADPRNWPFFASSAARPLLQKLIARGFATQMTTQTLAGAKELYDNWDKLTPAERAELGAKTGVGALFLTKGLMESGGRKARAPEEVQRQVTHTIEPGSPVGQVLREPASAPSVRIADSAPAARGLIEKDTVLHPTNVEAPGRGTELREPLSPDALDSGAWSLFGVEHYRDLTVVQQHAVVKSMSKTTVGKSLQHTEGRAEILGAAEPQAQARVSAPSDTAEFRNPNTARVVSEAHIPVVSHDEVLAQAVHNIIDNSGELQRAGVDISSIKTNGDIDAVLQRASDVVKSGLDPRAEATISFPAQVQLAADLGMSVEDLLNRRGGPGFQH
jgi:hypothetical protein